MVFLIDKLLLLAFKVQELIINDFHLHFFASSKFMVPEVLTLDKFYSLALLVCIELACNAAPKFLHIL